MMPGTIFDALHMLYNLVLTTIQRGDLAIFPFCSEGAKVERKIE